MGNVRKNYLKWVKRVETSIWCAIKIAFIHTVIIICCQLQAKVCARITG